MDNVPISPLIPISSGASYDHPNNHIIISSSLPTPRHLLQLGNNNGTAGGGLDEEEEEDEKVDAHDYATNKPNIKNTRYKYRECLKNHAASMGGNATDGCGEFMPGGEEGSLEALKCSACNCHRNFHRKETEDGGGGGGGGGGVRYYHLLDQNIMSCKKLMILQQEQQHLQKAAAQLVVPNQMIMPPAHANYVDGHHDQGQYHVEVQVVKKRFRTKFTAEQKEKMLRFAEQVGWRIQKQEESVVHRFCQEIGVKRRVLKVWMHNNKHNYYNNNNNNNNKPATTT